MDYKNLNKQFSLTDELSFRESHTNFPLIEVNNRYASAVISIYGGHLLSFRPHSTDKDMIFLSDEAIFKHGKAIRGGIPICWPWFGDNTENMGHPAHGFARTSLWQVGGTASYPQGTEIRLCLRDTKATRELWPYAFELELKVLIGETLQLSLHSRNTGDKPFTITQALHTYLNVDHIENVLINGLDGLQYFDKLAQ